MRWASLALIVASALFAACGCRSEGQTRWGSQVRPVDIFFSPEGKEYSDPSFELRSRLKEASNDEARRQLVEGLLDILEGPRGYAKFVVGAALFREPEYWSLSARGAEVIARNIFRIARPIPSHLVSDPNFTSISDRDVAKPPRWWSDLFEPINPYCAMEIEGREVEFWRNLPEGWRAEEATVELDGKVVFRKTDYKRDEIIREYVPWGSLIEPGRLIGNHILLSRLRLLSPGGKAVTLERTTTINVYPEALRGVDVKR